MRSRHLQRGDHIFVHCGLYTHHGVYCGGSRVIHYSGTLKTKGKAIVCETTLVEFAAAAEVLVQQYPSCDLPAVVIRRAESRLGERKYDLFANNCEHFAAWCKTGKGDSRQVQQAAGVAATAGLCLGRGAAIPCLSVLGLRAVTLPALALPALALVPATLGLSLVGMVILGLRTGADV